MAKPGTEIFREYATDGAPGSGQHKPIKADIREWTTDVETRLGDAEDDVEDVSVYVDDDGATYTRSLFSRQQEELYLTDRIVSSEYAAIRNGTSTTDFTTHMQALITRLIANGVGGKIRLPSGKVNFNSALLIPLISESKGIEIVGAGPGNSRVGSSSTAADVFTIGTPGSTEWSQDLVFADFAIDKGGTQTDGAFFNFRKTRRALLSNIRGENGYHLIDAGEDSEADSAQQITLENVRYRQITDQPIIDLISGAILWVKDGCKFDGNSLSEHFLIRQENTTRNFDGLWVGKVVCEQLGALRCVGKGVSNVRYIGAIFDRPNARHADVTPASGGDLKDLSFVDCYFIGNASANTLQGLRFQGTNVPLYDVKVSGCNFTDIGQQCIYTSDHAATYQFLGNSFRDCGFDTGTVPLIRFGSGASGLAANNMGFVVSRSGYDYGISWEGTGDRKSSNNNFIGAGSAEETGTP